MLRSMTTLTKNLAVRSGRNSRQSYVVQQVFKSTSASKSNNDFSVVFNQWPNPVVESNGDYRDEQWLEDHIGGPLYAQQKQLPRLPIPPIEQTLERFLPTALPLATNEQEVSNLQAAVAAFPEQASILQERLLDRAKEFHDSSWLQLWWNQMGYLQVRDPIVINVSYFFHFADDPTIDPKNAPNVQRAVSILTAAAEFRKKVCSGELPAEVIGKKDRAKTLCSTAYKYMFNACRIPKEYQDSYKIYDPAINHHAIIAVKGHFFTIDLVDPTSGEPHSASALEAAVNECIQLAHTMGEAPKIGYCTGNNRDDWAKTRAALLATGGSEMVDAMTKLESSAFVVCLDDQNVISRKECSEMLLHGGPDYGYNRFFDKSVQFVIASNGKAGFTGEHSMMDGMPLVSLADYVTKATYAKAKADSATRNDSVVTVAPIFSDKLRQKINTEAKPLLDKAKDDFTTLVTNNALHVQSFQGYGSNFIKKAGFSPDAFVQAAMQLATYRLWGHQAGTYEATQVRPFLHGRTETTRSISPASAEFVQRLGLRPALDEHDASIRAEKIRLLQETVDAHVKYIGQAAQAQGVDRHFLGLSLLVREGEETPDLYSDPVFIRSKRWRVSTSHLTHPKFDGWGYGQVVPDGVGLAYSIHPRHCVFNITALKETGWTNKLAELLEEAMLELRTLVELEQPQISKL